jgi:hypothetical protein
MSTFQAFLLGDYGVLDAISDFFGLGSSARAVPRIPRAAAKRQLSQAKRRDHPPAYCTALGLTLWENQRGVGER